MIGYHTSVIEEPQERPVHGTAPLAMSPVPRIVFHVDMDAFFAAIEQHDRPELRGLPVIVGARPEQRGVVATCSYEARRFGIHSAMPSSTALRLCPDAIFLPVRRERYGEVSRQVMTAFRAVTPVVEPVSIDEAFLDVTGVPGSQEDPLRLGHRLKRRIFLDTGLTCSVGIAPNKFLAKIASDLQKPDGLTPMPFSPSEIVAFLAPLPVKRIWGVGGRTAEHLAQHGLRHIGQLQKLSPDALSRICGPTFGPRLWELAHGRDDRPVEAGPREEKSISHEETFVTDIADRARLRQELLELVEKVGQRLRQADRQARTVQIKLRFADFRTITRQQSLPRPTSSDRTLVAAALELFSRQDLPQPIRLIGFGVFGLEDPRNEGGLWQPSLFEENEPVDQEREQALDETVDELRRQYGARIIRRGTW
jgi:DNA polymerase-4